MRQRTLKQPKKQAKPSCAAKQTWYISLTGFLFLAGWLLVACGAGATDNVAADSPPQIRTPHPTFTPTPPTNAAGQDTQSTAALTLTTSVTTSLPNVTTSLTTQSSSVTETAPATPTKAPEAKAKVKAIVNTPLVNIRSGPSTDFDIVVTVDRGQEYEIVGKNAKGDWWKVCCIDDKPGWVSNELVDTDGPVDSVAVVPDDAQAAATPAPTSDAIAQATTSDPTATAPTTATTPANTFAFTLITQEQFPETKQIRIFLYVYDGDSNALEGYSVHVTKDGGEVPVNVTSFGGRPGFTWPVADVRQRFQNMKVEFPGVPTAGAWVVQLSKDGKLVGPPATFQLKANDPNQELYVRYEQHK